MKTLLYSLGGPWGIVRCSEDPQATLYNQLVNSHQAARVTESMRGFSNASNMRSTDELDGRMVDVPDGVCTVR